MAITIQKLTNENFKDYEEVTSLDKEKPCYCSWWHIKADSIESYDEEKKKNPEKFRDCVLSKVNCGFHVGVIAYENDEPLAWISVGPISEFYWARKRIPELKELAETTAGIMCFNTFPNSRGKGKTSEVLTALLSYGKIQGWTGIEGYPFDDSALKKHGNAVLWPALPSEFEEAGFSKIDKHWLSNEEAERSIYYKEIN